MTLPSPLSDDIPLTALRTLSLEWASMMRTSSLSMNFSKRRSSVTPSTMRNVPLNTDLSMEIWLQMSSGVMYSRIDMPQLPCGVPHVVDDLR